LDKEFGIAKKKLVLPLELDISDEKIESLSEKYEI
jgi:hypothetical protein